jgi:murein L,D-transpeptidase YafK
MKLTTRKLILYSLLAVTLFSFRDAHQRTVTRRFFHSHPEGDGWYATYPAVFGSKSLDDKMVMGDRKTPEGTYHIASKRPHEKWNKIMDLDYPTAADIAKFNDRKSQGLIPKDAKIGDGIAIHGTWPHDEHAVDAYQMWTNGCVSLKNEDMDEVYRMTPVGAKVIIQH